MTTTSTTRWCDEPIVPDNYEGVASLVALARRTRGRIVEFDWMFSRDGLLHLRDAVFEWGSTVVGRYKCFDARVLAAINQALGDTTTVKVLNEPRNSEGTDCAVSCIIEGESFRLRGHAPFDIIFGYGSAGVGRDPRISELLGPTASDTLAIAVGRLGWDLRLLQDERLRPVQNALYGNALNYGISPEQISGQPAVDVPVCFHGPFSVIGGTHARCLFRDPVAKRTGVYLWTITVNGVERPWYVGQTRRGFGDRMAEHIRCFLSGEYPTYDAAALSRGENRLARHFHAHPELREFFFPGGLRVPAAIPFDQPIRLVISSDAPILGLPSHLAA